MADCEAPAELQNLNQEAMKPQTEVEKFINHNRHKTSAEEGRIRRNKEVTGKFYLRPENGKFN